jgi:6,7-dimethyl-8-ribityllumazine synthase
MMTHIIHTIEGDLWANDARFGIAATRFNSYIVEHLTAGAVATLKRHGVDETRVTIVRVPGAYELPLVARRMAQSGNYDALIALGCVIRGATPHFEYVSGACAHGLSRVALDADIPVAFGVLTTDTVEQAIERAGAKAGNKGADAAAAALEMVSLLRNLRG